MLNSFCKVTQQDSGRGRKRKPDAGTVIFLVWLLPGGSHVSTSNESHHFLAFTGINPGGVTHV